MGIRIDHRSYRDQQLDLIPGRKLGLNETRRTDPELPGFLADRVAEQREIANANGEQIIAEPTIALKALSHGNATFTHHDVAKFLNTHTQNADQFQSAYLKVTTSPDVVALGKDDLGRDRFTTRDMLATEKSLLDKSETLANRPDHAVDPKRRATVIKTHQLSAEQQKAVDEVTSRGDLKSLIGIAGSGKSTTLSAMRQVWEGEGYTVKGAALAGIAAENLEVSSGINSRTLASYELAWSRRRDALSKKDILVIDEAGMLGTRQLERVLAAAEKAHAKVVLVGDPEQLQAIEAGAPFRGIATTHGMSTLTEVRRQTADWQRAATADLATAKTPDALAAYKRRGAIVPVENRTNARNALLARWAHDAKAVAANKQRQPSQLVLAYTRDEVRELNTAIRTLRQQTGQLGKGVNVTTETGKREFSVHDRIRFGRNERDLGVKNGSLGTIQKIEAGVLQIKLDGPDQKLIAVDTKFYKHLDHGYATTVHKAQGTTVDNTYVLATPHFDRHTTYVALSRHRDHATVFYATDDFGGRAAGATTATIDARFTDTLSRAKPKDLAHDYLERDPTPDSALVQGLVVQQWEKSKEARAPERAASPAPSPTNDRETRAQAAAERWAARQKNPPTSGPANAPTNKPDRQPERRPELRRDGPEDDLEM